MNIPGAKRHSDLLIGFSGIVSELLRYSSSGEELEQAGRIETKSLEIKGAKVSHGLAGDAISDRDSGSEGEMEDWDTHAW